MAAILHSMEFHVNELLPSSGRISDFDRKDGPVVRARGRLEGDQLPVVDLRRRLEGVGDILVYFGICLPSVHDHVGDCSLYRPGIQLLVGGSPHVQLEDEIQLHHGEDHHAVFPEIP